MSPAPALYLSGSLVAEQYSTYVHELVWYGYNVLLVGHHNVATMSVGTVCIVQLSVLRTHARTIRRKGPDGPRPGQTVRRYIRTVKPYMCCLGSPVPGPSVVKGWMVRDRAEWSKPAPGRFGHIWRDLEGLHVDSCRVGRSDIICRPVHAISGRSGVRYRTVHNISGLPDIRYRTVRDISRRSGVIYRTIHDAT
jgi:hypothetical protein